MITVMAKFEIKEDKIDEFLGYALYLVEKSRKESTCISYTLNRDVLTDNNFTFIEVWESKEALDIHMNTDHFKNVISAVDSLKTNLTIKKLIDMD